MPSAKAVAANEMPPVPRLLATLWRFVSIGTVAAGMGCAQPLLHMPDELVGKADVYPVHGRGLAAILFGPMSFGPYRTVSIPGPIGGVTSSPHVTGVFSSVEHTSSRRYFDFALEGPGSVAWQVHCLARSDSETESHVVGFHFGPHDTGFDRKETLLSYQSGYGCQLDGPAAEHWTLEADEKLGEGTVFDAAGETIVEIQGTHERAGAWRLQELDGNLLVNANGGELLAVVQRSYYGAVYLSRELDPKRRAAVAAICGALLVAGH